MINTPIKVYFFTLTDTHASEHIYLSSLQEALTDQNTISVDDWRDADVVHLFEVNLYTKDTISAARFPTLLRILYSDTPIVVSTDDLYFIDKPGLTGQPLLYSLNHHTQRLLFKYVDAIIAISESVQASLSNSISPSKIHIVKHGVDVMYHSETTMSEEPFVLHVSLASKRKNPDAIRQVAKRLDTRFVIAGSGWDDIIPDTQRTANVELTGYVSEDELIDLYKAASIFYFPTLHEGFGLPILEAMAAGCAVVTSDIYSVPEVTDNAAVLCDPLDVDAHVETIRNLLNDETERRKLSIEARDRAAQFTWEKAAKRTEDVYRTVLREI